MNSVEILQSSDIVTAEGRLPSQIVLREVKDKTFATHIRVMPEDSEAYFILGRYFFNLQEAKADFQKRVIELETMKD